MDMVSRILIPKETVYASFCKWKRHESISSLLKLLVNCRADFRLDTATNLEKKKKKKTIKKSCFSLIKPSAVNKIWHWVNFLRRVRQVWKIFFSCTASLTEARKTSLPYYLPIAGGRIVGFMPFPRAVSVKWNANSLVLDLNVNRQVHFLQRKPFHQEHFEPVGNLF